MYKKYNKLLVKNKTTSYKVSKSTGVSNGTLSDWKRGKYEPGLVTLQKLALHFGVPVSYFIDELVAQKQK